MERAADAAAGATGAILFYHSPIRVAVAVATAALLLALRAHETFPPEHHNATYFVASAPHPPGLIALTARERSIQRRGTTMTKSIRMIGEVLPGVLDRVRPGNKAPRSISGVATGLRHLDELTGGWQNGDLIVIGGRPSMGKTAQASQFALHAALHSRVPVIYLSLDLSGENLALRLTARVSGVHLQRLRTARLDAEDWKPVEVAAQKLADAPLYLDDTAQAIGDLCTRLRDAAKEHRIGLAIIDVLQAISPQQATDRDAKPCQNFHRAEVPGTGTSGADHRALATEPQGRASITPVSTTVRPARIRRHRERRGPSAAVVP